MPWLGVSCTMWYDVGNTMQVLRLLQLEDGDAMQKRLTARKWPHNAVLPSTEAETRTWSRAALALFNKIGVTWAKACTPSLGAKRLRRMLQGLPDRCCAHPGTALSHGAEAGGRAAEATRAW